MLLFGISVSNYIWPWGQMSNPNKICSFWEIWGKENMFVNILIYDRALCALWRKPTPARLPLQSDTRFSSYKGPKVGFDTFLAISLCVYIGAHNNFRTECTSSKGTFLIKTVMSSKVIQGRLWAKSCHLMLILQQLPVTKSDMAEMLGQNVNGVGAHFQK